MLSFFSTDFELDKLHSIRPLCHFSLLPRRNIRRLRNPMDTRRFNYVCSRRAWSDLRKMSIGELGRG